VAASIGRHLTILLRSSSPVFSARIRLPNPVVQQDRESWNGPATGARRFQPIRLAIFCIQVFFEYDPSSATSLLSSAGISARECVCVSVLQYAVLWSVCVCVWRHRALYRSSPMVAESSCDLLRPGVLWLRSFFGNQSSFFGRHLDQAHPPHGDSVIVYVCASNSFPKLVRKDAREVDEGKWKEIGGKVGKGKSSAIFVATDILNLYWTYTRLSFFNIFLHPLILQTQEAKSVNVVAEEIGEPVWFTRHRNSDNW